MLLYEYKVITYYDWEDTTRPEIRIEGSHVSVLINNDFLFEITGDTKEDVYATLNDYTQLFLKASESILENTNGE